jgi:acyl-CoA synthetase (AMP-forming)/AMP-acid ligase II
LIKNPDSTSDARRIGRPPPAPAWAFPPWRDPPAITQTIPALLRLAALRFGDRDYVVFEDERISFKQTEERSRELALRLLASGINKGTRVGMVFPNSPDFVVTWMALARIGAVAVPISTLSTAAELQRIARHADLAALAVVPRFINHDYLARLQEAFPSLDLSSREQYLPEAPHLRSFWVQGEEAPLWGNPLAAPVQRQLGSAFLDAVEATLAPGDPVSIIYTSGSTGDPKGVIHSHGNLVREAGKLFASYDYQEDDRIFAPQPFFWVGGLVLHLLQMLYAGATIVGSVRSNPQLLDLIDRERITYVHVYPHVAHAIASDPSFAHRDFSRIRGGRLVQAIPPERRRRNQYYGNALGMTETAGPHTICYLDLPDELKGTLGPSMPGMEHRIVDVDTRKPVANGEQGELMVRGDCLMLGMVKREREEVFTADGWFATGDICSFVDDWLYFHGRVDDMIKSAGANVSPREVEDTLMSYPGVAQAFVCGVADETRGAVVGAIVVPHPGASIELQALQAHARASLSSYKVPRTVLLLRADEVPMTSSTKADRRAIARLLANEHKSASARALQ